MDILWASIPPNNGDFSKERRKLYACYPEATAGVLRDLEEEEALEAASGSKEPEKIEA